MYSVYTLLCMFQKCQQEMYSGRCNLPAFDVPCLKHVLKTEVCVRMCVRVCQMSVCVQSSTLPEDVIYLYIIWIWYLFAKRLYPGSRQHQSCMLPLSVAKPETIWDSFFQTPLIMSVIPLMLAALPLSVHVAKQETIWVSFFQTPLIVSVIPLMYAYYFVFMYTLSTLNILSYKYTPI